MPTITQQTTAKSRYCFYLHLKKIFIDNGFNVLRVLKVKVKHNKIFCNTKNIVYHAILLHGYETG